MKKQKTPDQIPLDDSWFTINTDDLFNHELYFDPIDPIPTKSLDEILAEYKQAFEAAAKKYRKCDA